MILKEYQREAVGAMSAFFAALADGQKEWEGWPEKFQKKEEPAEIAWEQLGKEGYQKKQTGSGQPCPHFCLKIPTGGGKTLLAAHAVQQFLQKVARRQTGLVLWVVPSQQIFEQTNNALTNRAHPLRKLLDSATGQRVKILNKKARFSPGDVEHNLCVLLLSLQSFSREKKKKEILKIFKDNGHFAEFFPDNANNAGHQQLLEQVPNLDNTLGQVVSSLGNAIKICRPLVVLDEGHKAKSELASSAVAECNPSAVVELSATPAQGSNILFEVAGRRLAEEEMIKLDLNAAQIQGTWQEVLDAGISKLEELGAAAQQQRKTTGQYIRPICVVQVQATGKDQQKPGVIHAEDARQYLLETGKFTADAIRVKTSTTNEIEGEDLLAESSPVRCIITKSALQEGWDCPFAYVLVALAGTKSRSALTQLVGRVLRQPLGRKTGNPLLDESYVFAPAGERGKLFDVIKDGFENEGLGDLAGRVNSSDTNKKLGKRQQQTLRESFKESLNSFALPAFVAMHNGRPRLLQFQQDILPWIDFKDVVLDALSEIKLQPASKKITVHGINFSADREEKEFLQQHEREAIQFPVGREPTSFFVRNILDAVPNPWQAHDLLQRAVKILAANNSPEDIAASAHAVLAALRTLLLGDGETQGEINRLAKQVFEKRLQQKEIQFVLFFDAGHLHPTAYFSGENMRNTHKNLFEPFPRSLLNGLEEEAVDLFENAEVVCWWHRNGAKKDFYIAGWQREKFYPDFLVLKKSGEIVVVETKGDHLLGNTSTNYKRELAELFKSQEVDNYPEKLFAGTAPARQFVFAKESDMQLSIGGALR